MEKCIGYCKMRVTRSVLTIASFEACHHIDLLSFAVTQQSRGSKVSVPFKVSFRLMMRETRKLLSLEGGTYDAGTCTGTALAVLA